TGRQSQTTLRADRKGPAGDRHLLDPDHQARRADRGDGIRGSTGRLAAGPQRADAALAIGDFAMSASVATLKALVAAFNDHDLDRIMTFFADDAVLEMPRGPDPCGRRFDGADAVRQGLQGRFTNTPDVHYGEDSHFVDGDMGISQWTLSGTMLSGERIKVRG